MEQELICPKCKGNKFSLITKDTFKCAYCGNVFSMEKKEEPAPAQDPKQLTQPAPQIIYIQPSNNQEETSVEEPKSIWDEFREWPEWVQWFIIWIIGMFGFFVFKLITGGL